ncbi:MAG: hypothetical protein SFW66_08275 [Gammaproteobacteria bacterium]|nr:hypothetical protein [Gammaproteobacteria bacterium]
MQGRYRNSNNAIRQPLLSRQSAANQNEDQTGFFHLAEDHPINKIYQTAKEQVSKECCVKSAFYFTPPSLSLLTMIISAHHYAAECPENVDCGVFAKSFLLGLTVLALTAGVSKFIYDRAPRRIFFSTTQPVEEDVSECKYVALREVVTDANLEGRYTTPPSTEWKEQQYPPRKIVVQMDYPENKENETQNQSISHVAKTISQFNQMAQPSKEFDVEEKRRDLLMKKK